MSVRILLCCGAGMSSGFLAQRTQKAADKLCKEIVVHAKSQSIVEDIIDEYDLLLLGPHYASHLDEFEEIAAPYNIPVAVIPQNIYGSLDGESLMKYVNTLIKL